MIVGKNLRLRALEKEDLPKFVEWLNDPEVIENLFVDHPFSLAAEEQWFEGVMKSPMFERPLCIEVREGEHWKMIGNLSIMDINWQHRNGELGIVIGDKAEWGKGHGTEVISLYINHLFNELNLHRVWLRVYDANLAGIRCYEKVVFQHEGTLREAIYKHGQYIDMHVMSILSTEWKKH